MVAVSELSESIMNAKPTFAASLAPALSADYHAPEKAGVRDRGRIASVSSLESFDVYRVSLEACRLSSGIGAALTANLRDQLLRASSSVVLNTAEVFGSRSRGIKRRHYEIARGSAIECVAVVDLASVLGVGKGDGVRVRELFSRAAQMLARLEARFR